MSPAEGRRALPRGRVANGVLRIACALLLTGAAVAAQPAARPSGGPTTKPAQPAAPGTARADRGLLRGLDKITGTTRDLPLRVGEAVTFGRLEVRLGECRYPADDPDSDAFAELTITDTAAGRTVFAGWMLASSPALSALDDARYDIWVVRCDRAAASGSGPVSTPAP